MNIKRDIPLAPYTTFGIGGPADYFIVAKSAQDIVDAVEWSIHGVLGSSPGRPLPFFILGLGANILVGDKGFRGLVIKNEAHSVISLSLGSRANGLSKAKDPLKTKEDSSSSIQNDNFITAESGITIEELIDITSKKGLSGLEHFAGIPSTLGGAIWQNLHFLSPDRKETVFIGDIVESAEILSLLGHSGEARSADARIDSGQVKDARHVTRMTVSRDYFKFDYDYSILHDTQDIVLSVTLNLKKEDPKIIQQRIDANLAWRSEKHPEYAWRSSAGSVFKKIEGYGAGRLIEQVGLKGFQIGGAKFSEKHANFIVNSGNAKAIGIRKLITLAQKKVKEKFNLDLQTEISFIGEF